MIKIYFSKIVSNAQDYLSKLNENIQARILDNKTELKQQQMISAELLLYYALRKNGYQAEILTVYQPKPVLLNSDFQISKAHSHNYVMVCLSKANLGCDLERQRAIKNPEKILSSSELEHYNNLVNNKNALLTNFWTAKEAYVKYYGKLVKPYKEISFSIEYQKGQFKAGKIGELFCYSGEFQDYSFSVVSKTFTAPSVTFVSHDELLTII
jgi:phosphopantetheinyl transferase